MSHYKPYPAYKDSGVEWLEKVPEHWRLEPLKYGANFVNGCAFKPEQWVDEGTPIIRIENLNGGLSFNCFDGEVNSRYHVKNDDLLFGWSGNRGTSFGPFLWPHDGKHFLNQHIFRICDFNFNKSWFYWTLKAVTAHVEDQAHGIIGMVHITKGDLGDIKIAVPPSVEQQAIANHLDRETTRIDALIVKKIRFMELLREKRQALITHAVTKGLDPSVKMKDSGVEWLGDVPEHWEVKAIRWLSPVQRGASPRPIDDQKYFDETGEYGWVRIEDVSSSNGILNETKQKLSEVGSKLSVKLQPGALFLSIAGSVGKPCITAIKACIHDGFVYFPMLIIEQMWLFKIFKSKRPFVGLGKLGTQLNLNTETVGSIKVGIPPSDEVQRILRNLDNETTRIDTLIQKNQHSIDLLKERRAALITAAVTGQIDLREAA